VFCRRRAQLAVRRVVEVEAVEVVAGIVAGVDALADAAVQGIADACARCGLPIVRGRSR